jgi:hypothetical protein
MWHPTKRVVIKGATVSLIPLCADFVAKVVDGSEEQ